MGYSPQSCKELDTTEVMSTAQYRYRYIWRKAEGEEDTPIGCDLLPELAHAVIMEVKKSHNLLFAG